MFAGAPKVYHICKAGYTRGFDLAAGAEPSAERIEKSSRPYDQPAVDTQGHTRIEAEIPHPFQQTSRPGNPLPGTPLRFRLRFAATLRLIDGACSGLSSGGWFGFGFMWPLPCELESPCVFEVVALLDDENNLLLGLPILRVESIRSDSLSLAISEVVAESNTCAARAHDERALDNFHQFGIRLRYSGFNFDPVYAAPGESELHQRNP